MNAINRRGFVSGAMAALALPGLGGEKAGTAGRDRFSEPERDLKIAGECDVLVAGGGPAGIAVAVTAARLGRRVRLVDMNGCLGGIWTAGMVGCMIEFGRSDIDREITRRLDACGGRRPRRAKMLDSNFVADPESLKVICEELCEEAGVNVRLHTAVAAVYREGRDISCVVTESKSGREAWRAKTYVDCTGDGDLAALAGCGYDDGMVGADGIGQPASLNAIVTVDDPKAIVRFVGNEYDAEGRQASDPKDALFEEFRRAGVDLSHLKPTLLRIWDNLYVLVANQEYGLPVNDADAITRATIRARREVFGAVSALARLGGCWKGLRVVATAEQIGHRRARRIHGRYTLTIDDCIAGRTFDDAIATCSFGMDVHNVSRGLSPEQMLVLRKRQGVRIKPYQVPLRACRAKDLDNLYMAGRCISGDFFAHASYRVTGTACQMGEGLARRLFGTCDGN